MASSILWRRIDLPGHEFATLAGGNDRWELAGTALFTHECQPCRLGYRIVCDAGWRTTSAHVRGTAGARRVELEIDVDATQRWRLNGVACPAVDGCIDIDLGFSPSTNLLPIRRLSLAVGQAADVRAAWLPFPTLEFAVLEQLYRREGEASYRYESAGGGFVRTLAVDAAGFVTDYPGLWTAESSA
jgi:hypothetical protein